MSCEDNQKVIFEGRRVEMIIVRDRHFKEDGKKFFIFRIIQTSSECMRFIKIINVILSLQNYVQEGSCLTKSSKDPSIMKRMPALL